MLSVFRAKATVLRTSSFRFSAETKWLLPGFVEWEGIKIHARIRTQQHLELAVSGTLFLQENNVVFCHYICIYGNKTLGANAAGGFNYGVLGSGEYFYDAPPVP
jgi:hypothetical protein